MATKTFPTLYKITSTGATQQWTIYVDTAHYYTRYGQVGGTLTQSETTVCAGKNIGRANATSASAQALLEAESLWTKKLKKDYTQDPNVAAGQKSELIAGGILPMLAHKFSEHGDKLKYPCFVQPKLDGHRCIGIAAGGLWSRTRKPITGVPHIQKALDELLAKGYVLDGELYNHSYRDNFEALTHFIRQKDPEPGYQAVQYHVYDMVGGPADAFRTRLQHLDCIRGTLAKCISHPIVLVETREVQNEDELMLAFEDFLAQGYEGAVARQADGLYVNKRSYDLLKIKSFLDDEFECINVEEGKGKMAGHGIFVCVTGKGVEFRAKMKGNHEDLAAYVEDPSLVIGKLVTVKYQGMTNKNGVPRFPVALRIRED